MENCITINLNDQPKMKLATSCMICDESIPLEPHEEAALYGGYSIHSKICGKCKAAILYMREQMP